MKFIDSVLNKFKKKGAQPPAAQEPAKEIGQEEAQRSSTEAVQSPVGAGAVRRAGARGEGKKQAQPRADKFNVRDLNLYYGNFHALKGIAMDIKEGEITAFIGPSGCGKSTFLKTLNRMNDLVPDCKITGQILIDGVDLYGKVDINALRKRVGMVFQKYTTTSPTVPARTACARRRNWTRSSSAPCARRRSGTNSKTASKNPLSAYRAASNSACASRAPSRWGRTSS